MTKLFLLFCGLFLLTACDISEKCQWGDPTILDNFCIDKGFERSSYNEDACITIENGTKTTYYFDREELKEWCMT